MLTAPESSIYGALWLRAGDVEHPWWQLRAEGTTFGPSPPRANGTVRLVDRETAAARCLASTTAPCERVGEVTRSEKYWERVYKERRQPASPESDGTPFFTVVHYDRREHPTRFARYSVKGEWPHGQAANLLRGERAVRHLGGGRSRAWEYLLGVDLVATLRADGRPVDEPLRWRLADPRRVIVTQLTDHLWVRAVDVCRRDVGAHLCDRRRASCSGWSTRSARSTTARRVEGSPGGATVRTHRARRRPPALGRRTSARSTSAASALRTLARAGRVEERTGGAIAAPTVSSPPTPPVVLGHPLRTRPPPNRRHQTRPLSVC